MENKMLKNIMSILLCISTSINITLLTIQREIHESFMIIGAILTLCSFCSVCLYIMDLQEKLKTTNNGK